MNDGALYSDGGQEAQTGGSGVKTRLVETISGQLTRGVSPRKISLTLVIGAALGVFPILGVTTFLCFVAASAFKLNHPVIQTANWIVAWAQIPLILIFVRIGEAVVGAQPVPFTPHEIVAQFQAGPLEFLRRFGLTGLHGIVGWSLTAAPAALGLHALITPAVMRIGVNNPEQEGGLS